jgi:hypothetical protein
MLYIIYDTALNGIYTLPMLQKNYPANFSLFKGTKDEILIDVAPYLFCVDDDFLNKINKPYTSLKHLIAIETNAKIEELLVHLQQFIYQKEGSNEYYFRFWDGRVLARFLPASNYSILSNFFNEATAYYAIDIDNDIATKYQTKNGKLLSNEINLNKLFVNNNTAVSVENVDELNETKPALVKRKFF